MAEILDLDAVLRMLDGFGPLRRVILATPGTLQGTLSAYFGEPVDVDVQVQDDDGDRKRFVREVNLVCRRRGLVVCRARSEVQVEDDRIRELVRERRVGLGRISEALHLPTDFTLESVGGGSDRFWRVYRLVGPGFSYRIREEFPAELYADAG